MIKCFYVEKTFANSFTQHVITQFIDCCLEQKIAETPQPCFKEMTFLNKTNLYYATNSLDDVICKLILQSNIKRHVVVLTTNEELAQLMNLKGIKVHFLYSIITHYPAYWLHPITSFPNAFYFFNHNQDLVEVHGHGVFHKTELIEITADNNTYIQMKISALSIAQGIKLITAEVNAANQNAKRINKKAEKQEHINLELNRKQTRTLQRTGENSSLYDNAVRLNLLPKDSNLHQDSSGKEIFDYMQEHRTSSKEQFLSLLIYYYNVETLSKDQLHLYKYCNEYISEPLENKGVIELYSIDDIDKENKMIALSYESLELISKIPEVVDADKILITLPEYILDMKGGK